jgi:adenylate kinase family enzyme
MSKVIILTGPSGAGKSSVSKELAENLTGTWALVSQDSTRELIKAGFKSADDVWTDKTKKQWEVSIIIICDMIKRYREANINCIIELFAPPVEFKKWRKHLKGINYQIVVLLPSIEKTLHRNANRPIHMKEFQIRENHDWFSAWKPSEATIIDTSHQSLKETVEHIRTKVIGDAAT